MIPFLLFLFLLLLLLFHFPSSLSVFRPSSHYSEQSLHVQLVEECPFGSPVVRLPPLSSSFSPWHLSASAHSPLVSLNASSGILLTSGRIDRESLSNGAQNGHSLLEFVFVSRSAVNKQMAAQSSALPLSGDSSPLAFAPSAQSFQLFRLFVEILDVNDNAPNFGTDQLNLSISESVSSGGRFPLGKARDADDGQNGTIGGCELMPLPKEHSSEDISEYFRVDKSQNGEFVLELGSKPMDREQTDYLRGQLRVWDAGTPRMETVVGLGIRLLDANDNAPRFEQTLYKMTFDQNEKGRSEKIKVGKVKATDLDEGENGRIKYEMNGEKGAMEVDERSGELFIRRRDGKNICPQNSPPSECFFVVNAIDGGMPPLSAKTTVALQLAKAGGEEEKKREKSTDRDQQKQRPTDHSQSRLRIKNLPAGQSFASVSRDSPNGTVLSVVTMENAEENLEEKQMEFVIKGAQLLFRLEQLRNGLALLRWNGTAENMANGRNWTVEIGRKRRTDDREIGPTEKVQIFSRSPSDHSASAPPPLLLSAPIVHFVRLPEDLPVGSLVLRLNSSFSSPIFRLLSSADLFEMHPFAGLLRLKRPFAQLDVGEKNRNVTIHVEVISRSSRETSMEQQNMVEQMEIRIEVFDVNDHRPLITDCPSNVFRCVLSLRLAEDFPLGVSFVSVNASDSDSGSNSALRFSLRPFASDFVSVSFFAIDAQRGNVSLRRPLDFERRSEHRLRMEVTDGGTPEGRATAILEIFVEDANDQLPEFAAPSAVFLSLPLSLPSSSVLLSVSAFDSDLVDQSIGLRYSLLQSDANFPRGMFQLSGDQLSLAKSPAAIGLNANDQFVVQISAMDSANHSALSPLSVHFRIVVDEAKVPPRIASLQLIMGQCLSEEDIVKNVLAFPPGGRPKLVRLSLLQGDSSLLIIRSAPLSLCLLSSSSPTFSSLFLLADFGSDGWTLIRVRRQTLPTDRPRLFFLGAAPNVTVTLPEMAIGTPLHRFRVKMVGSRGAIRFKLEGDRFGILGIHPTEGLLWLAKSERKKGQTKEMRVVAQLGQGVMARQKFWLKIEGNGDQSAEGVSRREKFEQKSAEQNLLRFPSSVSLPVSNERQSLRPGDLLANLALFFPISHQFELLFNFHSQNLSSNWSSDEFFALFPNGEIRLLKEPPLGLNIWERKVTVQLLRRLCCSKTPVGERIVPTELIIRNPLQSAAFDSLSLQCPNPPKTFRWHSNVPTGTFIGTLVEQQNFDETARKIMRIELLSHLDLFLVDELSGKVRIRTREIGTDREGQKLDIRYRIGEAGKREKERRRECEAKIEFVDEFARKEEKWREIVVRKEIIQRNAEEQLRHEGLVIEEMGGRNWPNGTEMVEMRDKFGLGQKFELRHNRLFASPNSLLPIRPLFLLFPFSSSSFSSASFSSLPSVRLRLVPPFADHLLQVQISVLPLFPSADVSSSSISIPRNFPVGLPFLQLQLHFLPELLAIVVANAPRFSPRFQLRLLSPADDHSPFVSSSSSTSSTASVFSSASSSASFSASAFSSASFSASSSDSVPPFFFFHLCPLSGLLSLQTQLVASDYALEVFVEDQWTGAKGKKQIEFHVTEDNGKNDEMIKIIRQKQFSNFDGFSSNAFPSAAFSFWVEENAAIGTVVGQFDRNFVNQNTSVIGAEEMPFVLNRQSGTLTVIGPIGAEKASLFSFHLKNENTDQNVSDGNFDDDFELLQVDVFVKDENEHLPIADGAGGQKMLIFVAENVPIGSRIVQIDMRDEDRTSELFAFVDPFLTDDHNAFFVDEKGWLKVATKLDREQQTEYQLHIRLMDGKLPKKVLFSSFVLNISVTDVNDCAPQFPSPFLDFFVDENSAPGTVFGTLLAIDHDNDENGTVRYRMIGDWPAQFALDPLFGYLTVIDAIDRELLLLNAPMELIVEAYDLGSPQQRSAVKVRVQIVDQDDNRPEPEHQHVETTLNEGTAPGEALIRLNYTDRDEGSNAIAIFAIVKVSKNNGQNVTEKQTIDNDQFHVGTFSGILSVAMPLEKTIRTNETIHLNISLTAFTARWPSSFISVSLLVVPRSAAFSPPLPSLVAQQIRLFLHPLVTVPWDFHRIDPFQPDCSFVLLNQSRLFSISDLGFVRLLNLPDSDHRSSSDQPHALSVHISSSSDHFSSVILTLFVHIWTLPSLLLTPPVQFVQIAEDTSTLWEVKVHAEQTGEDAEIGDELIRYELVEESCAEEGKRVWEDERRREEEEEEERALEDPSKVALPQKRHFSIGPFSGILRSKIELLARSCSLWRVRIKAFHLSDEWNSNGANGSVAFLRIRVTSAASPPSASSAMPSANSSSEFIFSSPPHPLADFDCVFLFPSPNSSSSSLLSPFAIIQISENELLSSDSPIARVSVISASEEDKAQEASSSITSTSLPIEFEMEENPSKFLFRLDGRKGTVKLTKALDRESDGERHRMTIWGRIGQKIRTKMPCILEVIVDDANDNAPRFGHILHLSLSRSTPVGSVVFRVRSEDPDSVDNARNWFSLSGEGAEQAKKIFSIDKWTGELTLIRELAEEKKRTHRFGITVQDVKWHVHSTMTVQIVDDQIQTENGQNEVPKEYAFEFIAFGKEKEGEEDVSVEQQQQQQQVVELGRVPWRCCANGMALPTVGWAWTKHEGSETALIADRRLFKILENGDGTAEREISLFCADGIGQQKVRLRWRRSSAAFPFDFPPIVVPNSADVHSTSSLNLFVFPSNLSNSSPIFPLSSITFLPIVHQSEKEEQIGRVIVEESDQTERNWHFELEKEQSDHSWVRVDKRSGIISANASAFPLFEDGCWESDQKKLIGVKVTDGSGKRKGRIFFRLFSSPSASVLAPKFTRRFWHFSVPHNSPNGTIVGQLQIDRPICEICEILMDKNSEKTFQIDQRTGELTIKKEKEEEKEREMGNKAANVILALIGGGGHQKVIDRCFVRVFFSHFRPPCVTFPSPNYSVRLSSAASDQTVLLRFDIILHTEFKILLKNPSPLPFCFADRSPSVLSLCSSLPPLPRSSPVFLLLILLLVHPSGHICSRSSVSVLILDSSPSFWPFVPPGGYGFVRKNALVGQNVLQFLNGRGPFEIVDKQMDKLFRLHPSSGVLSIRIPFVGLFPPSVSLLPIFVRSPNATFHIFVLLEDEKEMNENTSSISNAKIEVILPVISSDKIANVKSEELPMFTENYYPSRRQCVPISKRLGKEVPTNVTITSSCTLLLPPLASSSLSSTIVPLGANNAFLHIHSFHLLEILPRLVELRLFSSTKLLGTTLSAIGQEMPDLVLLLPFALSDHFSAPFGFHRLLIAFRDQNGNILPQSESIRRLQMFSVTFSHMETNVWEFRVEKTNYQREEENVIFDCLEGRKVMFGTDSKVWAPFKMDESCLRLATVFGPKFPFPPPLSSSIASANKFVPPPVLSFMPSSSFGDHFGFVRFSGVLLPRVPLISLQFLTVQSSALLLYFSLDSSSSHFVSVDLINGKPRLNVGGLNFPLQSVVIEKSVNDGKWWHLALSWTNRRISLALEECQWEDQSGDKCAEMGHNRIQVHLRQLPKLSLHSTFPRPLSFVIFGDISVFPDILRLPGRFSDFSFVGCQRRIAIDGIELIGSDLAILEEQFERTKMEINATVSSVCPFNGSARDEWPNVCHGESAMKACRDGICVPEGKDLFTCQCESQQVESENCEQILFAVSLRFRPLRFVLSSRTFNRLSFVPLPGNFVHSLPRPSFVRRGENEDIQFAVGLNMLELDFRHLPNSKSVPEEEEKALLCMEFENALLIIALEINSNSVRFILHRQNNNKKNNDTHQKRSTPFPFAFRLVVNSSTPLDSNWHRLAMGVSSDGKMLRLQLDDMESVVGRSPFPNFFPFALCSRLKSLSLGSPCKTMSVFRGCVRRLLINNQLQQIHSQMNPMPKHKKFLHLLIEENQRREDATQNLCLSSDLAENANFASATAVFVLLLLTLLLFVIIRFYLKRRQKKSNGKENAKRNQISQKPSAFVTQRQTPMVNVMPSLFDEEENEPKMVTLENWRGMAVSSDTFSSLGFSSCSTFPHSTKDVELQGINERQYDSS